MYHTTFVGLQSLNRGTTGPTTSPAHNLPPLSPQPGGKQFMNHHIHYLHTSGSSTHFPLLPLKEIAITAPLLYLLIACEFHNQISGKSTFRDPWNLPLDLQGSCHSMPKVLSLQVHIPKPFLSKPDIQKFDLFLYEPPNQSSSPHSL